MQWSLAILNFHIADAFLNINNLIGTSSMFSYFSRKVGLVQLHYPRSLNYFNKEIVHFAHREISITEISGSSFKNHNLEMLSVFFFVTKARAEKQLLHSLTFWFRSAAIIIDDCERRERAALAKSAYVAKASTFINRCERTAFLSLSTRSNAHHHPWEKSAPSVR